MADSPTLTIRTAMYYGPAVKPCCGANQNEARIGNTNPPPGPSLLCIVATTVEYCKFGTYFLMNMKKSHPYVHLKEIFLTNTSSYHQKTKCTIIWEGWRHGESVAFCHADVLGCPSVLTNGICLRTHIEPLSPPWPCG